jgi:hypothetical protein
LGNGFKKKTVFDFSYQTLSSHWRKPSDRMTVSIYSAGLRPEFEKQMLHPPKKNL